MKKEIKNDPPKKATFPKRFLALILDGLLLYLAIKTSMNILSKDMSLEAVSGLIKYSILSAYFFFILVVIPQTIFSQTFGKFVLGLKVVSNGDFKRLNLSQTLTYGLLCGVWSGSTVVDLR